MQPVSAAVPPLTTSCDRVRGDAKRDRLGSADLDEIFALGVGHLDGPVKRARTRVDMSRLFVPGAAREPAGDGGSGSGFNSHRSSSASRGDRSLARVARAPGSGSVSVLRRS